MGCASTFGSTCRRRRSPAVRLTPAHAGAPQLRSTCSRSYGAYRTQLARTRTPQAGIDGWTADVALPAHLLSPFACAGYRPASPDNSNLGGFCDRALERRIAAARDRPGAATWSALSRRLEASAPAVPLVNRRTVTLVSERVANFQHHPLWGTLLEQLSVR